MGVINEVDHHQNRWPTVAPAEADMAYTKRRPATARGIAV
jgi:hypothetical protein